MSLEIREPRDHELDEVAFITAYSFEGDRSPEALEGIRRLFTVLRPLAAFQDGRLVASPGSLAHGHGGERRQPAFRGRGQRGLPAGASSQGLRGPTPNPRAGDDARGGSGPFGSVHASLRSLPTLRLDAC